MFGKRKINRGRRRDGVWVFGMVERGTNRCFLIPVENITKDTLVEIIKRWVRPGSIIIADGWSSYKCLKDNRFKFNHLVVNHTNEYKDPFTGAHTNTIEGCTPREASTETPTSQMHYWKTCGERGSVGQLGVGTGQMRVTMESLMRCIKHYQENV